MKIGRPQNYSITLYDGGGYSIGGENGEKRFSPPASSPGIPKLYVIYDEKIIHYVGAATRRMSERLNSGFNASGIHGYHGYKWKDHKSALGLSVWSLNGVSNAEAWQELECIEAEIVFLCRKNTDQWPASQHEIHFHKSIKRHRELALQVYEHVKGIING